MVDDYVAQHKETIAKKYRDKGMLKTNDKVTVEHDATFLHWFREQVLENPPEEGSSDILLIHALAHGPAPKLATYQSYDINGYTFYKEAKDMDRDYQNSRVTIQCMTDANGTTKRFYRRVEKSGSLTMLEWTMR